MGKNPSRYMKVCSLHFTDDDFFKGNLKRLKRGTYPTQKLPKQSTEVPSSSSKRCSSRRTKKVFEQEVEVPPETSADRNVCDSEPTSQEVDAVNALLHLSEVKPKRKYIDFQVQVNTPNIVKLSDIIENEKILFSFTGLSTFAMLQSILKSVSLIYNDTRIHRLLIRDRIIMLLVKLKLNLSLTVIATLFGISPNLCKSYFEEMLGILSPALSPIIYFPEKEEVLNNIPICFAGFENTHVVIDCTEMQIQRPKCLFVE
ncbi:Helix-turn-helix of DDE superfamily endonuclease [Popillia japonica]|uniref:Helix-turn-helix of DDE superfamily endonuclease n=1 Tax=Popillia japonica TaxID=7064 RepID=A0AAW1KJ53_POPJA